PTVNLTSPVGGESWAGGSGHNITWTASDNVGITAIDLAYSTDGGASYPNAIATGISNTGSYAWTVPSIAASSARVRVTAHAAAANLAASASPARCTIPDAQGRSVHVTAP